MPKEGQKRAGRGHVDSIRKEKLMAKLLSRVATELGRSLLPVTSDVMDKARYALDSKWSEHGGSLSDLDIKAVVHSLKASIRSQSVAEHRSVALPTISSPAAQRAATPSVSDQPQHETPSDIKAMILHTTKKQRQLMADREWIEAAENDRLQSVVQKRKEKEHHLESMRQQKAILDHQMDEHNLRLEAERQEKLRRQREVEELIEQARAMQREEQHKAQLKANKEREFRAKQQREVELERERQRIEEHNEQVRMFMMNQEELRRQKELEQQRKLKEQQEWKKTVDDNQRKLLEKEVERERIKELDREYQRKYIEAQEKQDREREEAKKRKEARASYFQKLAGGVAALFQAKEQDQTAKIEAEYQRQLQRSLEDEQNRQRQTKQRLHTCLEVQQQQIIEKKAKEEKEREERRQYAESLRRQGEVTLAVEEAKRLAARQEAVRTKEFLATQLQLSHLKETKPLETSIARPASQAASMYSPSRFSTTLSPS